MSTRRARVVVAYATVKILDPATGQWTVRGFYQGAVLPLEADPDNVANLVRREYCEWLDAGEAKTVDKQEADEAAEQQAETPEQGASTEPDAPTRPAQAAPKAEWVAYAVEMRDEGVSEEDAHAAADAKTKADLIAEFGG